MITSAACKRLIGLCAVASGGLVKSNGYATRRPAGGLVSALRTLDRWGADEIVVLDISRRGALDERVLHAIRESKVTTPVAYGGGIRATADVQRLMTVGCDRFILETLLFEDIDAVRRIADLVGRQALIASVPIRVHEGAVGVWRPHGFIDFIPIRSQLLQLPVSEYLVTAIDTEGRSGSFPVATLAMYDDFPRQTVLSFGGHDAGTAVQALAHPAVAAVVLGNINVERELTLPGLRSATIAERLPIRSYRLT